MGHCLALEEDANRLLDALINSIHLSQAGTATSPARLQVTFTRQLNINSISLVEGTGRHTFFKLIIYDLLSQDRAYVFLFYLDSWIKGLSRVSERKSYVF